MAKKHLRTDGQGNVKDDPKIKGYSAKVLPYREPDFLREYRLERERYFWQKHPEQRPFIEEWVSEMKKEWELQDKRK